MTFGLAAGLSPGPLQALVVTSSLERGFGAGWRVAVAPLVTDAPIIVLAVALLSALPTNALNGLGVAGGIAAIAVGVWSVWTARRQSGDAGAGTASDLWRGAVVNVLSPHPWAFWIAAGGPVLVSGWRRGPWFAAAFLAGFYLLLVGSKVMLAWVVARGRHRLDAARRQQLIVATAALLVIGGGVLIWQGASGRFG